LKKTYLEGRIGFLKFIVGEGFDMLEPVKILKTKKSFALSPPCLSADRDVGEVFNLNA